MAKKLLELIQWIAAVPRDAWLEIAIEGSTNLSRRIQVSDLLDLAVSRVQTVEADHVLAVSDAGAYLRFEMDGMKELQVDDESAMGDPLPDDAEIEGRNAGTGFLIIQVASSNVLIHPPAGGSFVIPSGGSFRLKRIAPNEYDLEGDTEPASG